MPNRNQPVISLETLAECIKHDPASWNGVSLLYLRQSGNTQFDVFYSTIEHSLKSKPDILVLKDKNNSCLLLGPTLSADPFKDIINGYCLVDNVATQSEQVCSIIDSIIAAETITAPITDYSALGKTAPSILIVEDDAMTSKMVAQYLKRFGTVMATSNSRQATANYNVQRPDVVFLDIHYKDDLYDGLDVLTNLLSMDKKAFVVMVSGDRNPATIIRSLTSGAQGFIAKPFRAEDFAHYLNKFTNRE